MYTATGPVPETRLAAIQLLQRGHYSAKRLRDLLSAVRPGLMKPLKEEEGGGFSGGGDRSACPLATAADLLREVLQSFDSTLLSLNYDGVSQVDAPLAGYRGGAVKPEESEESGKSSVTRGRRGCYKRRKSSNSMVMVSNNPSDDGHQWRKYGQKSILNTEFPRNYFRCTHKTDQGCQATKQVQKISNGPPMYQTTYYGHHTCRSPMRAPQIIPDDPNPSNSSIILSFKPEKSPDNTAAHGIGTHTTNIPFSMSQVHPSNYAMLERTGEDSSIWSEYEYGYGCFTSPLDFTPFSSAFGFDQGELALPNSHSFPGNTHFLSDDSGELFA
ncbi:hypothetical protein SAY86_029334 [Trapa natans]|uniref:WRKY domain-containing protein n=1 Tax=Trapa natans TaxID=22666 RepID=A0AAN7LWB5_TRANT|nr:hypothetical protein SAY86_029334 [Trapa natans]